MYWIKDENKAWNVLSERVVPYISSLLPVGLHLTMGDFAFSAAIGQFISRGLMWNTRVYKLAVFWGVRSERGLNHGLWQKYFHKEKIGKRERDGFYIAYFPIPWIFGFIKFNLALTVTWELQGQILAENVSFGARWNFKTATLWQTNWFFAGKKLNTSADSSASKTEYSSWFFRFKSWILQLFFPLHDYT